MKNIVLLDDDPDEFDLLRDACKELNMSINVSWFQEFGDLCNYLQSSAGTTDMLFLDINMPKNTGLECLKNLKDQGLMENLPVIIYTNGDYQQNIDDAFSLGATIFLKKSSSFEQLKKNVKKIIQWNLVSAISLPAFDRTLLN